VSPGGTFPVDNSKIREFTKCAGGIGGFGGIGGIDAFGGYKKARRLFAAVLHRISQNAFVAVPANPLPDVWFRIGA